ncbi:SufE family protein [Thorsellia anophelis]|uniref:Cysteine desulfuration protein SufE n=1 Tax=Thorsellia anophelis DSM 18579 TaxID=1123402 RepID=A0A1H9ZQ69_9GAMM|nr:SufE family protein [Thorsellia anophelis]SES83489.1 cysteine desulfuration protein SufE [Thorsellia anophelis DSM 18579]
MCNIDAVSAVDIQNQFKEAKNWESAFKILIQLGQNLPNFDPALKLDDNLLHGCESNVWLVLSVDSDSLRMDLQADSDSKILRGILYVIRAFLNSTTPDKLKSDSLNLFFTQMGIYHSLSASRKTGIDAINAKILNLINSTIAKPSNKK